MHKGTKVLQLLLRADANALGKLTTALVNQQASKHIQYNATHEH